MHNISKTIGSISLICGTAIGAGMLALPIGTANCGFWPSIIGFVITWVFITISSLLLLEVNLIFKDHPSADLISLSKVTLGLTGEIITTILYLALLYAALCAYLTGCAGWLNFIPATGAWLLIIFATSLVIVFGTSGADFINKFLSVGLIISYFSLLFFAAKNSDLSNLTTISNYSYIPKTIPLIITAFAYSIVLPSIVSYMDYDKKSLIRITIIGSTIPLLIYTFWQLAVSAALFKDPNFLATLNSSSVNDPINFISNELIRITQNNYIGISLKYFAIFAILTSLIGVSLSLYHFCGDLLNQVTRNGSPKPAWQKLALTFAPPFLFLLFNPTGFDKILSFAGIFVALLLGLFPVIMAWQARKLFSVNNKENNKVWFIFRIFSKVPKNPKHWQLPGGKPLLIITGIFFTFAVLQELWSVFFSHIIMIN